MRASGGGWGKNLYQRNGVWWARVQVAGKDVRRSLRTRDRAEAKKRLKRILEDAERIRFGDAPRHTYEESVVAWAQTGFGGVGERTADRYRTSLRMLDPHFGALFLDQVTRRTIGDFVRARTKLATNATVRRDLTALSRLLAATVALGWRDDNPAKEWDRSTIREQRDPITRPDPRAIEATIRAAHSNMAHLIRFLLESGVRLEEACALRRSDVDWTASQITVIRKGRRLKTLDLSPAAMAALRAAPAAIETPFVFWIEPRDRDARPRQVRITEGSSRFEPIRNAAQKLAQAEGWEFRAFRLHDLRHEFAIRWLKNGGSIYELQQHLGHTSVKTTEIYLDFLTPDEAAAAKRARHAARHSDNGSEA